MFALGKTKVFFRTGQVALLERLRQETLSVSAVVIQKTWKGFVARRRYQLIRQSILTIQVSGDMFISIQVIDFSQFPFFTLLLLYLMEGQKGDEKGEGREVGRKERNYTQYGRNFANYC